MGNGNLAHVFMSVVHEIHAHSTCGCMSPERLQFKSWRKDCEGLNCNRIRHPPVLQHFLRLCFKVVCNHRFDLQSLALLDRFPKHSEFHVYACNTCTLIVSFTTALSNVSTLPDILHPWQHPQTWFQRFSFNYGFPGPSKMRFVTKLRNRLNSDCNLRIKKN